MENKQLGYICIFRSIKNHWIWNDEKKFKWWMDILLTVNYSKEIQKVNIGNQLYECGRGQSIRSLQNWSSEWNVSKDTARNFLALLQNDNMIVLESLIKTTRITVCNFDSYQTILHDKQTQTKRKPNANQTQSDTNNKDKEGEEVKIIQKFISENVLKNEQEFRDWANEFLEGASGLEDVKMKIGIDKSYFIDFVNIQLAAKEWIRTPQELRRHFVNWAVKQKKEREGLKPQKINLDK